MSQAQLLALAGITFVEVGLRDFQRTVRFDGRNSLMWRSLQASMTAANSRRIAHKQFTLVSRFGGAAQP